MKEANDTMAVRIGFIGTGGIAVSHLANLAQLPDAEVVALCDLAEDRIAAAREAVGRKAPGARALDAAAYTDYRAMLRDERLDAVYLCLPPFAHGDPEEAVIAAGVPMLVEKPVALDLAPAARLLRAIRERGLLVASGYQLRYASYTDQAREVLAGRTIGQAVVTRFGRTPGTPWYHRQDRSGGQLIEMATHQIDLLRALVGEVRTVYAAAATRINQLTRPDYDIFDANSMTLTFENGAVGSFVNNFLAQPGLPPGAGTLQIFADGVNLAIGGGLRIVTSDGVTEEADEGDAMARLDAAFVRAVAERRADLLRSDYENGIRTLAVTVAGERSARTGQVVDVAQLLAEEVPGL